MITALKALLIMTALTGVIYPLLITTIAQVTMPFQADGSLVKKGDKIVGSLLIAQGNDSSIYFWPRPSAGGYQIPSGGSNLGPTSRKLQETVAKRVEILHKSAPEVPPAALPAELLFASGSGVDPHITVGTAYFQMARIAKARGLPSTEPLKLLIDQAIEGHQWGLFGPKYVNVLNLNLLLDQSFPQLIK